MQKKDYGRVLARPKLLVNDNQEGTIKTEEQTSVAQEQTTVIPGSAATAPTATTTVGFQSYTAGITLTIKPHISKGDQLQLEITLTRTDFRLRPPTSLGGTEYPTPPDLLTSDVQTIVTVPNNTTIILGGLERLKQGKGGTKVPLIGDLPLIGGLFRSTANSDAQSRLYVFVKAHILRPGEQTAALSDLEIVSSKNRKTFEKYEKEMQEYEDWPGIKPQPMDPERILEVDEDRAISINDRQVFGIRKKGTQENEGKFGRKSQPIELNQAPERDGTISLKKGQPLNKSKKETKGGGDLPGTKSKPMHPMQLLKAD
jgi:general secretion pathway protein D